MARFRRMKWWTRTTGIFVAASFAMIAFGSWSVASPIGASPDDDFHLASIWCGLGERPGLCEAAANEGERLVPPRAFQSSACYAFKPEQSAACTYPDDSDLMPTGRGNFVDNLYPPVFYGVMSLFASQDVGVSTIVMRLVNSAFFVGMITGVALLLPRDYRGVMVVAAAVTIVPLGMFIVPSVNPSSWAFTSAATLWVALVGYFQASNRRHEIALGALAISAALLGAGARADSAVYNGVAVVVAVLVAGRSIRKTARKLLVPLAIAVFSIASFVSSGQASAEVAPVAGVWDFRSTALLLSSNIVRLPELWAGVFGTWSLGWFDTPMPGGVWVLTIAVFAGTVFAGFAVMFRRKAAAVGFVVFCLIFIPLVILTRSQVRVGEYVQPRYFLPLMVLFAGVALIGVFGKRLQPTFAQTISAIGLLSIANAIALALNIRRYVTGVDEVSPLLDNRVEWWWDGPISPMGVWIIGTLAFTATLIALVLADRTAQFGDLDSTVSPIALAPQSRAR